MCLTMMKIEYTGKFTLEQQANVFHTFPAVSEDPRYQPSMHSAEFRVCSGSTVGGVLCFALKQPSGNETYKMEIRSYYHSEAVLINQPFYIDSQWPYKYDVKCTVTFHSSPNRDFFENTFVSYCHENAEQMMTFKCVGEDIKAITSVMSCASPVIDAMMKSDCIEAKTKTVKIEDFSANVIKKTVELFETGQIADVNGVELDLCKVADKYEMDLLKDYVSPCVVSLITNENVIELFEFAQIVNNKYVEEECIEHGHRNWNEIPGFGEFENVSAEAVKNFCVAIKNRRLPIS